MVIINVINNNIRDIYVRTLYHIMMFQRLWRKQYYKRKSIKILKDREIGKKYKCITLNMLKPCYNLNYKIGTLYY